MVITVYGKDVLKVWEKLLKITLGGMEIENTIEITDVICVVYEPKPVVHDIFMTPTSTKFFDQMMLKDDKRDVTLHHRLGQQKPDIIVRLKSRPESRRAYFTFWEGKDILAEYAPCAVGGQFLIRRGELTLRTYFRSNDAYNGFPINAVGFINLQHEIAEELGVPVGWYIHHATSMHVYNRDLDKAEEVL